MSEPALKIVPLFDVLPQAMPKKFTPPTPEEVQAHCAKIGLPEIEGEKFVAYFESCGWVIGKSRKPMVSWRGAMSTWRLNWLERGGTMQAQPQTQHQRPIDRMISNAEYERVLKRIDTIRGTYSGMQEWAADDKAEIRKLKQRRDELKKLLGLTA